MTSVYPISYGNEQETSLRFLGGGQVPGEMVSTAYDDYLASLEGVVSSGQFDSTGFRVYIDAEHLEMATPECSKLAELVPRIQGVEERLEGVAKQLVEDRLHDVIVGISRRVVDSYGNSFACHDNFGFETDDTAELFERLRRVLRGHVLTRSFVTGAGYVQNDEYLFGQKIAKVDHETNYGHLSSLYRSCRDEGGTRIEIRCNDVNISPWAIFMRLGSTAIALAVGQTHMASSLPEIGGGDIDDVREAAGKYNTSPFGLDDKIRDWSTIEEAIAYQDRMAEIFLSEEMNNYYGRQPAELVEVAQELRAYCADMRRVLRGEAPFTMLADRADWAAKLETIQRRAKRDEALPDEEGKHRLRAMGDLTSREYDLAYDYIQVARDKNRKVTVRKIGTGYGLRDKKHRFRREIKPLTVARCMRTAPKTTRAAIRSSLIEGYDVADCGWTATYLQPIRGDKKIGISLPNVRQTRLTTEQYGPLTQARRRKRR